MGVEEIWCTFWKTKELGGAAMLQTERKGQRPLNPASHPNGQTLKPEGLPVVVSLVLRPRWRWCWLA